MDCSFPSFLNIYLFLFNTQLLVRVEFIDICHSLFEAVLAEWGIVGLTGFTGCKLSPAERVCRKNLFFVFFFSRKVIYPSFSAGSKENFKLHYVSPLICRVIVLCHSCFHPFYFSIRTFEHRCVLDSDKGGWALVTRSGPEWEENIFFSLKLLRP